MNTADSIKSYYDSLEEAQKAQLLAQYEQNYAQLQKQLESAPAQYQALKNEAYVNNALAERGRRETLANMGLSGAGGTSLSLEQRNTGSLLRTLGDVSRQQQDYSDNVNTALYNLGANYKADISGVEAKTASERMAALSQQARFEAQYEQARQKNVFDQAYSLYKKRLITAAQFTEMTGIALKKSAKKTGSAGLSTVPYIGSYYEQGYA
ncbi:MAG: hypothetical protein WDA65_07070 [Christensenellales bacterium]